MTTEGGRYELIREMAQELAIFEGREPYDPVSLDAAATLACDLLRELDECVALGATDGDRIIRVYSLTYKIREAVRHAWPGDGGDLRHPPPRSRHHPPPRPPPPTPPQHSPPQ